MLQHSRWPWTFLQNWWKRRDLNLWHKRVSAADKWASLPWKSSVETFLSGCHCWKYLKPIFNTLCYIWKARLTWHVRSQHEETEIHFHFLKVFPETPSSSSGRDKLTSSKWLGLRSSESSSLQMMIRIQLTIYARFWARYGKWCCKLHTITFS